MCAGGIKFVWKLAYVKFEWGGIVIIVVTWSLIKIAQLRF
jgi:hypothetical protein